MPQDSQTLPSENSGPDIEMIEAIQSPPTLPNGQGSVTISSDFIEVNYSIHEFLI